MQEQGWYTKDRVKDGDNKKVATYYKKEFAYTH
jgi:hypothetical protein